MGCRLRVDARATVHIPFQFIASSLENRDATIVVEEEATVRIPSILILLFPLSVSVSRFPAVL